MIYSKKHNYLYISTPKSGTHTMYAVLQNKWDGERLPGGYHRIHLPDNVSEIETIFTTVRHPFERVVSAYNIFSTLDEYKSVIEGHLKDFSFDSFIDYVVTLPNDRKLNGKGYDILSLQTQRVNIFNMMYLKIEDIENEFMGLPFVESKQIFPTLLKREHLKWNDYKTKEREEKLYQWLKKDFDLLGYNT